MKSIARLSLVLLLAFCACVSGCDKQPEAACIVGSGITAGCTDVNQANCERTLNGTWHSGSSCADLGYGKSTVSSFALSEIRTGTGERAGRLDWVEVVNASEDAVILDEFSLIGTTPDGFDVTVPLTGVLEPCGVLVIGRLAASDPVYSTDLPFGFAIDGSGSGYIALTAHGSDTGLDGVVSALTYGSEKRVDLPECADFGQIENLGPIEANRSYTRLGWPANDWVEMERSDPNSADRILGCNLTLIDSISPEWSPLASGPY